MAQGDAMTCVSEMRSFKGLKEDGSDDGQLELIGSTCALESTTSGFRASFTRQKAIEPNHVLLFFETINQQFRKLILLPTTSKKFVTLKKTSTKPFVLTGSMIRIGF